MACFQWWIMYQQKSGAKSGQANKAFQASMNTTDQVT
jgi:hypothetical protein